MAILGVDQCGKPHRSLADPDYLGMLLTTSAIHVQIMEIRLSLVKPLPGKLRGNLPVGKAPYRGEGRRLSKLLAPTREQPASYAIYEQAFGPLECSPRTKGSGRHLYELLPVHDPSHVRDAQVRRAVEATELLWYG